MVLGVVQHVEVVAELLDIGRLDVFEAEPGEDALDLLHRHVQDVLAPHRGTTSRQGDVEFLTRELLGTFGGFQGFEPRANPFLKPCLGVIDGLAESGFLRRRDVREMPHEAGQFTGLSQKPILDLPQRQRVGSGVDFTVGERLGIGNGLQNFGKCTHRYRYARFRGQFATGPGRVTRTPAFRRWGC